MSTATKEYGLNIEDLTRTNIGVYLPAVKNWGHRYSSGKTECVRNTCAVVVGWIEASRIIVVPKNIANTADTGARIGTRYGCWNIKAEL